jgi:hypothetical protein
MKLAPKAAGTICPKVDLFDVKWELIFVDVALATNNFPFIWQRVIGDH